MQIHQTADNSLIQDFYVKHNSWLYSWLCKKIGSTFDAADLTQDTFLRLFGKEELTSIKEPRAYLTTIAHGLMVSHIRRRDIERIYHEEMSYLASDEIPSLETRAIALEILIKIDTMLDGLPLKVRKAFLYSQLEELTHAQIATKMNISIASVRLYISKAILHCMMIFQG